MDTELNIFNLDSIPNDAEALRSAGWADGWAAHSAHNADGICGLILGVLVGFVIAWACYA